MNTLDAFIDIYFRVIDLDNMHASPSERGRAQAILIEREKALGLSSDQLDQLLEYVDEYKTNENAYAVALGYYENCLQ